MRVRLKVQRQLTLPVQRPVITIGYEDRCFTIRGIPNETRHSTIGITIGMLRGAYEDDGFKLYVDQDLRMYFPKSYPIATHRKSILKTCEKAVRLAFGKAFDIVVAE